MADLKRLTASLVSDMGTTEEVWKDDLSKEEAVSLAVVGDLLSLVDARLEWIRRNHGGQ
jgi:hypothetical protein